MIGCEESLLAQIIIAIALGLVLSFMSASLVLLLTFIILMEAISFSVSYNNWFLTARIVIVFASVAGWLVGRSIHNLTTRVVSKHFDNKRKLRWICHRE